MKGLGVSKTDKLRDKNGKQQNGGGGIPHTLLQRSWDAPTPDYDRLCGVKGESVSRLNCVSHGSRNISITLTCAVDRVKQGNVFSVVHY